MKNQNQLSNTEIKSRRDVIRMQRAATDKARKTKDAAIHAERMANRKTQIEAYAKVKGISVERAKLIFTGFIQPKEP